MDAVFSADLLIQRMKDVIEEEENHQILETDLRPINNLLLDVTTVLQDQHEEAQEALKIWLQLLHNCLAQAISILHRYDPPQRQRCLDCLNCKPGRLSKEVREWKVLFDYLFQTFQREFSLFVSAPHQIVHGDPIPATSAEESVEPLSKDEEAWMLFKRIAFKNSPVSEDIEEHARKIADECSHLAITRVAAAMIGKNSVDEWKSCLSSIKNADPPFPDTHPPGLDKHLYQQLRWCYDALPNSNVKNCFLYCAMYRRGAHINVEELVETWIAEGLVKSKEGSHLMDMAIGRTYINLLIHRCFFENATNPSFKDTKNMWTLREVQRIRVADVIRDVATYIGEKEEKCVFKAAEEEKGVFKAAQELHNFPETENEECKRISLHGIKIENLPTEFRRPKLVSLFLSLSPATKEVPSGFLFSLASLKVLHLSNQYGYNEITSIPSSIGQLKQLEFLNLSGHQHIKHLPKEIGQLSSLQFLNVSDCRSLKSLPSEIGGLKNLKSLDLSFCYGLTVIPDEISQLTSLNKLYMMSCGTSSGVSEEETIWNMKDLGNLTMLIKEFKSSPIKVGIMGNWLEMRHLWLDFKGGSDELPHDMQNMSKLQSFRMGSYQGLGLPDYTFKFQNLEYIKLEFCHRLKELSPLERLPNLKHLELHCCLDLKELGIGKCGFLMLEKLVLSYLDNIESIVGTCNNGVWNETTLPRLSIMIIRKCSLLKRLPVGIDKLLNLRSIIGEGEWWQTLIWDDESMKIHLQNLFTASHGDAPFER